MNPETAALLMVVAAALFLLGAVLSVALLPRQQRRQEENDRVMALPDVLAETPPLEDLSQPVPAHDGVHIGGREEGRHHAGTVAVLRPDYQDGRHRKVEVIGEVTREFEAITARLRATRELAEVGRG